MTLHIGDVAPNFSARSTHGAFRFYAWMDGNWVVLLAYPRTFAPDCAKEIAVRYCAGEISPLLTSSRS